MQFILFFRKNNFLLYRQGYILRSASKIPPSLKSLEILPCFCGLFDGHSPSQSPNIVNIHWEGNKLKIFFPLLYPYPLFPLFSPFSPFFTFLLCFCLFPFPSPSFYLSSPPSKLFPVLGQKSPRWPDYMHLCINEICSIWIIFFIR